MNTKIIALLCLLGLAISIIATPSKALAKKDNAKTDTKANKPSVGKKLSQQPVANDFCSKFPETAAKIQAQLNQKQAQLAQARSAQQSQLTIKQSERDAKLQSQRATNDGKTAKSINKLKSQAKTDEQKLAVGNFEKTINTAVSSRQQAISNDLASFKQSLNAATAARKTVIDKAVSAYTSSVKAAISKARSDCGQKRGSEAVRSEFDNNIKAATAKFQEDSKAFDRADQQIQQIIKTRQDNMKRDENNFKSTIEKAKQDLQAAFKKK